MISGDNPGAPDWAAVRAAYIAGTITVSGICDKFSISAGALYDRRELENWPLRTGTGAAPRAEVRAARRTKRLVARLFRTLEQQMKEIENRVNGDAAERDAAARERDARTLASLVRTLEKLCALDAPPPAASDPARGKLEPENVARMREAIARRIARIASQGNDRELP